MLDLKYWTRSYNNQKDTTPKYTPAAKAKEEIEALKEQSTLVRRLGGNAKEKRGREEKPGAVC